MSSQILKQKIKSLGAIPSADSVSGLQKQLAQLEQPEMERVLTEAEEAILAEAKPETEAEAIAALDSAEVDETENEDMLHPTLEEEYDG